MSQYDDRNFFRTGPGGGLLQRAAGGNWYRYGWAPGYGPHPSLGGMRPVAGRPMADGLPGYTPGGGGSSGAPDPSLAPGANVDGGWGDAKVNPGVMTKGYTPDYNALLEQDPGLMQYRNNMKLDLTNAASSRDAALKALSYAFNGSGNQFSDMAQIGRQYNQGVQTGEKSLASRGMLHSGEDPYLKDQLGYQRGGQEYTAGRNYSDQAQQALQAYINAQQSEYGGLAGAIGDASSRLAANPVHQPSPGYASLVDGWQGRYGRPVYQDMQGNLYDSDGNPMGQG